MCCMVKQVEMLCVTEQRLVWLTLPAHAGCQVTEKFVGKRGLENKKDIVVSCILGCAHLFLDISFILSCTYLFLAVLIYSWLFHLFLVI